MACQKRIWFGYGDIGVEGEERRVQVCRAYWHGAVIATAIGDTPEEAKIRCLAALRTLQGGLQLTRFEHEGGKGKFHVWVTARNRPNVVTAVRMQNIINRDKQLLKKVEAEAVQEIMEIVREFLARDSKGVDGVVKTHL